MTAIQGHCRYDININIYIYLFINVGETTIKHPCFDGLYQPLMVMTGGVFSCLHCCMIYQLYQHPVFRMVSAAEDTLWSLHPRQMDGSHRVPFDPYGKVPDVSPFAVAARFDLWLVWQKDTSPSSAYFTFSR